MGSEHYCLRWNNHQSNLLGVFSQLLQDESLVDVTLACSEGASIRAHKVVLSACSSYFQSLFLDHPARHPIVILKDVRFSELRTLVEFMYKGEVNVQYCQLSALLKTAESLKVKGLAEMTNQNTALREPEREPERLRPHSATKFETLETSTSVNKRLEPERCSPSPTRLQNSPTPLALYQRKNNRDHHHHQIETQTIHNDDTHITKDERSSSPDDDGMSMHSNDVGINMTLNSHTIQSSVLPSIVVPPLSSSSSLHTDIRPSSRGGLLSSCINSSSNSIILPGGNIPSPMSEPIAGPSGMGPVQQVPLSLKKEIDWDKHEEKLIGESSSDFRHPHDSEATTEPHGPPIIEQGGPMYTCMYCGAQYPHQSKLTRHILSHSLETLKYRETGHLLHPSHLTSLIPHELPPHHFTHRQAPPLEPLEPPDGNSTPMDIEFAAVAASAISGGNSTSGSDQGSVVLCKFCGKSFPDVSSLITHLPVHTGDRPFKCEFCGKAFKLRHHMKDHCRVHTGERPFRCGMCGKTFSRSTILKAHEKTHYPKYVRKFLSPSPVDNKDESPQIDDQLLTGYRGPINRCPVPFAFPFAPLGLGLFDSDPSRILNLLHHQTLLAEEALRYRGVFLTPKESVRANPLAEMLSKEQERLFKRNSHLRDNFRYPFTLPDLLPAHKNMQNMHNHELNLSYKRNSEVHDLYSTSDDNHTNRSEANVLKEHSLKFTNDLFPTRDNSKEILDDILTKRGGSYLKEGLRFNPLSKNDVHNQIINKEKTSNSSSTSSSPSIKPISETLLLQDLSSIEEETKCTVCMATFPSVWLLEQHAALQHSNPMEEKPFICDQCGQSYRYRSAYVKHREQNHRARLPADKLFTCDVCGMQFRYLKSFKKHRLNHALERIHGKHEKKSTDELVSSSNETFSNEDNVDLKGMIKEEDEDEEQDDTIDSASKEDLHIADESQAKITSSEPEAMNHNLLIPKPMSEPSIGTASLSSLLRPDATIGLNPQEASLLNFLRADAVDKQRERRFACPFCGKCVRSKENLKLHVRKHTGERPFVCLFCGRAFGGKSDLTRHLRIHTGERPYHCEACGKCFARADYLSKHLTTHLHNTSR